MFSCVKQRFLKNNTNHNLKSIFISVYILMTLIGIFPYSLKFNSKSCKVIRRSIYLNAMCAVTVNIALLGFLFFHVQHVVLYTRSSSFTETITTQINYILELVNLNLATFVAYIWAYKNRYNYIKILNCLSSSWTELPTYENRVLDKLYIQVQTCAAMVAMIFVIMVCVNFSRDDSLWKILLVSFSFNLPMIIQIIMIAFYSSLILMAVASLAIINENCLNLIKDKKYPMGYFIKVENRSATVTLRHLELVYVKVIETKREINAAFEASILVTLLQCFHCMVSESYIIYHGIAVKKNFSFHETFNCTLWLGYQVLKIFALAYTGDKLKCEVCI